MNLESKETYVGEKFLYEGYEYLRIDGVWFKWDNGNYIVIKENSPEKVYQEQKGVAC